MMLARAMCGAWASGACGVWARRVSTAPPHVTVKALLGQPGSDQPVTVKGWVKGVRRQKEVAFLDVDDGSSLHKLQVVAGSGVVSREVGFHTAVVVTGVMRPSHHARQTVEMMADTVQVVGSAQKEEYPFKARKRHPTEYVRKHPHLRARTNAFSTTLRARAQLKMAMHRYFDGEGFLNVDTPVITSNDCEGGGEVFVVQPLSSMKGSNSNTNSSNSNNSSSNSSSSSSNSSNKYFGVPAYLTVSGQLHLEAMASGMTRVYNFNPAFRAENSQTRRHLAEFWMVEAEEAFLEGAEGMAGLMGTMEGLVKESVSVVLEKCAEDVGFHWAINKGTEELVTSALNQPFVHLPYQEAMDILVRHQDAFQTRPTPGHDLGTEHEAFLTGHVGQRPVFVTDWPALTKAFYMCTKEDDPGTVFGVDLLLPGVGEVAGGGLREHRAHLLQRRLEEAGLTHSLQWYLDLRRMGGGAPSGGFGLGFERLLQFVLGAPSIKDTIPFSRWPRHCPC